MAPRSQRPYDPYHDWHANAGRDNFNRLFLAEERTMADNGSKDDNYRLFRNDALCFMETNYKPLQFDALIPYMAMTFVDRFFSSVGPKFEIPEIAVGVDNTDLFLTCCLSISWKLRTKSFVLDNILKPAYKVDHVIEMEKCICRKLEWRLRTVMPFWFIEFYAPFLNAPPLRLVYQLIVKAQYDMAFTAFRPSVIAASAMQIVIKNVLSDQVEAYRTNILSSDFLKPVEAEITKCSAMLDKLHKPPSTANRDPPPASADIGGSSSSAAPIPDSKPATTDDEGLSSAAPIPDSKPATTDDEGLSSASPIPDSEPATTDEEGPTSAAPIPESKPTTTDDEGPSSAVGIPESKPATTDEEGPTHREGKQPIDVEVKEAAAGEIHPIEETEIPPYFPINGDKADDLMNFKLEWTELIGDDSNKISAALALKQVEEEQAKAEAKAEAKAQKPCCANVNPCGCKIL